MSNRIGNRLRLVMVFIVVVVIVGVLTAQFATAPDRRLFALDAATGKVLWSTPIALNWNAYMQPVIDQSRVFTITRATSVATKLDQLQVSAFDAATGRDLWTYQPPDASGSNNLCEPTLTESPVAADGHVYLWLCTTTDNYAEASAKETLVALDAATGAVVWQLDSLNLRLTMTDGAPLPIVVCNGAVYTLSMDTAKQWTLDAFDEKTGAPTHHFMLANLSGEEPPYLPVPFFETDGHNLYINVNGLTAVDPSSGTVKYALKSRVTPWTAINGLFARVTTQLDQVAAYDPATGAQRWLIAVDKVLIPDAADNDIMLTIQMAADAQSVYVIGSHRSEDAGWLIALNAADGSRRWITPLKLDDVSGIFQRISSAGDIVVLRMIGTGTSDPGIVALSSTDGSQKWFFAATAKGASPSSDGQRVYLFDESARYRDWLAALNPAWHR